MAIDKNETGYKRNSSIESEVYGVAGAAMSRMNASSSAFSGSGFDVISPEQNQSDKGGFEVSRFFKNQGFSDQNVNAFASRVSGKDAVVNGKEAVHTRGIGQEQVKSSINNLENSYAELRTAAIDELNQFANEDPDMSANDVAIMVNHGGSDTVDAAAAIGGGSMAAALGVGVASGIVVAEAVRQEIKQQAKTSKADICELIAQRMKEKAAESKEAPEMLGSKGGGKGVAMMAVQSSSQDNDMDLSNITAEDVEFLFDNPSAENTVEGQNLYALQDALDNVQVGHEVIAGQGLEAKDVVAALDLGNVQAQREMAAVDTYDADCVIATAAFLPGFTGLAGLKTAGCAMSGATVGEIGKSVDNPDTALANEMNPEFIRSITAQQTTMQFS